MKSSKRKTRRRIRAMKKRSLRPNDTYKVVWAGTLFGFLLMLFLGWMPILGPLMVGLGIGFLVKRRAWSVFAGFSAVVIGGIIISLWALLVGASFAPMLLSVSAFMGIMFGFPIMYGFLLLSFASAVIGGIAAYCAAAFSGSRINIYRDVANSA